MSYHELLVVMGGGLDNEGYLLPNVKKRCEFVLNMFNSNCNRLIIASSSFTLNAPPKLTNSGMPLSEASAIYQFLLSKKCKYPIICEQQSHDTVGSVFFTLYLYAKIYNIKRVNFITSRFHAKRLNYIAELINKLVFELQYELSVTAVDDVGDVSDRCKHEQRSLDLFIEQTNNIKNMLEFADYFFGRHTNYNHQFGSQVIDFKNLLY